jgi:pimeloyl-ACP methyl ester carboxylesterase
MSSFKTHEVSTNGVAIYVRGGGAGPAVVLLHGYGEAGDLAGVLAALKIERIVTPSSPGRCSSRPRKNPLGPDMERRSLEPSHPYEHTSERG